MTKDESVSKKEKCFVIMPISDQGDYPTGHFDKVYEQIFKPAIEAAGYEAYRVDEDHMCDSIISKIFKALQESPMALCDLSNRNPNVLYELGIRQAYDKPVVLVKDDKTERIFDVSGISTVPYKSLRLFEDVLEARERIRDAIISTKEGKQNSIIKVINVQSAVVSSEEISKEDRIEVLLSGLIRDVKDLKRENRINTYSNYLSKYYDKYLEDRMSNIEINDKDSREYDMILLNLKRGVTDSQVRREINDIMHQMQIEIDYKRQGRTLGIKTNDTDYEMMQKITTKLKESLCD